MYLRTGAGPLISSASPSGRGKIRRMSGSQFSRSKLPPIPEGCGVLPAAENRIGTGPQAELWDAISEEHAPRAEETGRWVGDPRKLPPPDDALERRYRLVLARALALTSAALLLSAAMAYSLIGHPPPGGAPFSAPVFFKVIFVSQLFLVGMVSRYVQRLGALAAAMLLFSYAAFCGMEFAWLVSAQTLAVAFLCGALMCGATAGWGYLRRANLARPITPVIMTLGGGLTLVAVNLALGTPKLAWTLSSIMVVLFAAVEGAHAHQVRDFYQEFDDDNAAGWKASVLGALLLMVNSVNLYLLLTSYLGRSMEEGSRHRRSGPRL